MVAATSAPSRVVVLAGATGLVGREILRGLLADDTVAAVHVLVRRPLDAQHPRLTVHTVDFRAVPALPEATEAYLALGTTIKVAGSQPAFRAVDFEANHAVARAAKAAGVQRVGLVSAMGADAKGPIFYNRVKGELEEALARLNFQGLVVARPSFLVGDRTVLGQPERPGEKLAMNVSRWLKPVIPRNYRSIQAVDVARALLTTVPRAVGLRVLMSGEMQGS